MINRTTRWFFPVFAYIVLLTFSLIVSGQNKFQTPLIIRAQLVDNQTLHPVVFAHIINKTRHTGATSDSLGIFLLRAFSHDSLFISTIGYYPLTIAVDDSLNYQLIIPKIKLRVRIYDLADVEVYSLGTYQEFKHKFLSTPMIGIKPPNVIDQINRELKFIPKHSLQEQASIPLGSPVTALYMLFNREGRQMQRLEKARERDKMFLAVNAKYNRNVIAHATGLRSDMLEHFMKFCQPDDTFIVGASEYQLFGYIYHCYDEFMESLGSPSKNKY